MLDLTTIFKVIAKQQGKTAHEMANQLGMHYITYITKTGRNIAKQKVYELEYMIHEFDCTMTIEVKDATGKVIYRGESDPNLPLAPVEEIQERQAVRAENALENGRHRTK